MKTSYKITAVLASFLLALGACTPKEELKTPVGQPGNMDYDSDYGSITVTWTPVEGAALYYYKVVNPLRYIVASGTTDKSYITVGSLQPATTYTVYLKAIPSGEDVDTMSASDFMTLECTTAAPKEYDFEWSHPATIYWDWDNQVYKSNKAVFGYDKSLQEYVIQSWGGVLGMDIVFSLSDKGEWLIDYAESTAYASGPTDYFRVDLYHGIGGTSAATCGFYTDNTGSSFSGNSTGGHAEAWMFNPNGDWTGYYLDYGEYTPEPEPEPEPFEPDPDADYSWSKEATAYFNGAELGEAAISFDAETGVYTVTSWYGVEGYDLRFTRDDSIIGDEAGIWIIDTEKSSAYVEGPDADGYYLLAHGKAGKGIASTLLLNPAESAYEGDPENGEIWAYVVDPSGKTGYYSLTWETDLTPFKWACDIYVGGDDRVGGEKVGTGIIAYDSETKEYSLYSWYGVEGYDLVFTVDADGWWINPDKTSALVPGSYYDDGYCKLYHGVSGTSEEACTFWGGGNGYGWFDGNSKSGNAGFWFLDANGNWTEYRIEWEEGSWSAPVTVLVAGEETGHATLSYDIVADQYTLQSWYGVVGYDLVFTVDAAGWWINPDETSALVPGSYYDDGYCRLYHGVEGTAVESCEFWGGGNGYGWMNGNAMAGNAGFWFKDANGNWCEYRLAW